MARTIQVVMTCDVDETDDVTDLRTVRFALGGHDYEIDLCTEHLEELEAAFQPYVSLGRKAANNGKGGRPTPKRGSRRAAPDSSGQGGSRAKLGEVRTWARAQGYEIGERGRISEAIQQAFAAAH